MRSKNMVVLTVAVVAVMVAIFGTVAYGIYSGISDGQRRAAVVKDGTIVTGSVPRAATAQNGASTSAAAPALGAPAADAIAQPAGSGFNPGSAPYGGPGGVSADGISAWGVAYKEVSDPNAQADAALVKAAYLDAEKRATDLATATGNKLGKLVALSDYTKNQPYFKPCVATGVPAPGKPVPQANGATGSGSGAAIAIAPAPCQVSGNNQYLVAWVYVRHAL